MPILKCHIKKLAFAIKIWQSSFSSLRKTSTWNKHFMRTDILKNIYSSDRTEKFPWGLLFVWERERKVKISIKEIWSQACGSLSSKSRLSAGKNLQTIHLRLPGDWSQWEEDGVREEAQLYCRFPYQSLNLYRSSFSLCLSPAKSKDCEEPWSALP